MRMTGCGNRSCLAFIGRSRNQIAANSPYQSPVISFGGSRNEITPDFARGARYIWRLFAGTSGSGFGRFGTI